ncbi:MAG: hypothetical protein IKQ40_06625 [Lachnospiraceae bacterium]|nr:hypothetical protein [Lachnospiraceae bacterium]
MSRRSLSAFLITCIVSSSLCGCNVSLVPATGVSGEVPAAGADKSVSAGADTDSLDDAASGSEDRGLTDLPTTWDLTDLFTDKAAFDADAKHAEELIAELEQFRGTLGSAEGIRNYLESPVNLEILATLYKIDMYREFLNALNAADPEAQAAMARFYDLDQKLTIARAFFDTEIMEIPLEERKKIFSDEQLAPYAYYLRKYTDENYMIPGEEAQTAEALMEVAVNSKKSFDIFDNVELIRPTFTYPDGTEGVLTNAESSRILQNPDYDRKFRSDILSLRNSMRQPYRNTYASFLEGEMKKNIAKARLRGFDTALDYALYENGVDPAVYQRIIEFAHSLLPSISDYYKVRKELLGVDELKEIDLVIPSTTYNPGEITYEDAVNLGRSAVAVWGDEYLKTFDMIITSPHIDVYPSDTKNPGAFEYLIGNETTPYVLYNFNGMTPYTSTIVHEMGHAVYSEFSAENQNIYNSIPGIFTQEVTSTANEVMFHKRMVENASSNEEKLYWLEQEIDLFVNTLITQCKYAEFEDYCYKILERGGSLNGDDLNKKWLELSRLYLGDIVKVDDDNAIGWARIPHLYNNYYVYQYATSITYAASICNLVDKNGQDEIDDYIRFLKAGASISPADSLRIANVDPLDDKTYEEAGTLIKELIDEYTATVSAE